MKRLLLTLLTALCLLVPAGTALATYTPFGAACQANNNASTACSTDGSDPIDGPHGFLRKTSIIVSSIAGVSAVIVMIVGGLQYIVSNGDPQKTANARNAILGAAIGLGIIVGAQAIILFVLSKLS